jgi:hypothetical protein
MMLPQSVSRPIFVSGSGDFKFAIPAATDSKTFLLFMSSDGGSTIKLTLTYADATVDVVTGMEVHHERRARRALRDSSDGSRQHASAILPGV